MKITIITAFIFAGLLQSCMPYKNGQSPSSTDSSYAPPSDSGTAPVYDNATLQGNKDDFENTYHAVVSFSIGMKSGSYFNSSGGNTVIGVCEIYSDGSKKVWFNQDWWNNPSTTSNARKILYFHELGHCYFNRTHDSRTYSGGRPYSMMNPIIDPVLFYYNSSSVYKAGYIQELGSPTPLNNTNSNATYPIIFSTYQDGSCD
ncbi:MAG: hypothetical protein H7328_07970 [Bdellovibrio sp.]|nr:hypothetical protein [Bdellovibrio sp.]